MASAMVSTPLQAHPFLCIALLLYIFPSCSAQYDDTTVAVAVVVAIALLLIALAAVSIALILIIHWWRQHKKEHMIRRSRRRAHQRRQEIIAISTSSSSTCDTPPPKPRSSSGKRVKWSMDLEKEETCLPKPNPPETASANHGGNDGRALVSVPVHTVDVPVTKRVVDQQPTHSANEQNLDSQVVGKLGRRETDEALPPEESDNLLDHEVTMTPKNEEDSDNDPVSFL